jgi:endonuclease-8
MPEGPEIRRAADRVAAAVEGEYTADVFFAFDHLKRFEPELRGQRVEEVTTRGKAMLTRFEGGLSVYSHNQLYGRWYVMAAGRLPRTGRQLRFAVETDRRSALLYSASEIDVLDRDAEGLHPFLRRLGPDVLSQAPSAGDIAERLRSRTFSGRQIGALLLDQGFVAGLGNYLRAEILFEAEVDPRSRSRDLETAQQDRLAARILSITRRAYRTRGVTLPSSRAAAAKAEGEPRREYRFWVYGRPGKPCRLCDTPVVAEPVGGRKCFWCPSCQRTDVRRTSRGR